MSNRPVEGSSNVLRFDLAVQRNHVFVYTLGLLAGLLAHALGVFPARIALSLIVFSCATGSAAILYLLYRRGIDRRYLNPIWMVNDIILVTLGVYATGGLRSPWFIWYTATASAAAFASGKTAAYLVSAGNTVAYMGLLIATGGARTPDEIAFAFIRMLFIFGASYFFLVGVANLQQKRMRIRQLEAEGRAKVAELTRLTQELSEANRRSQEADRLKSQFLANMSHELRTPMNSIIGFSEILLERLDGRIETKHLGFLRHINTSGQHLLAIINDVLDLSKIEAGKMEVYPEYFSIAPVVESVCHVMRGMSKSNPNFIVAIPEDLPQIETDLAKFKQILFNLLSNAVKFSPPGAAITIRATLLTGAISVSVQDEGIGIEPANQELIFHEFRQVDGTARREYGGTGLGLALVRRFVELQGGRISVESSPGRGSTFTFMLPVRSRAAVVNLPQESGPQNHDRILVVEDDPNAYELIASALSSAGFLSLRARHGDEALRLAREAKPIAATLDLVLPGLDGWEVLKKLKSDAATRDLPVVIISMIDNRDLGLALGADDYFVKPVDRDRLIERIRGITSRAPAHDPCLLLIDDDPAVHALLEEDLRNLGFRIYSAFSGEEGLVSAREKTPDVIILDMMMPGMTGFEVAERLNDDPQTARIPILVLTSRDISTDERAILHSKVASFVRKGRNSRDQLIREIRRVTAHA